jgi:AraC-like DNA-binding protein
MAELATFDQFPTFGRMLATSATAGNALVRGVRLFRLLSERQRFVVRLDGRQVAVVLETTADGSRLHREGAEFLIGGLVVLGRRLTGKIATPKEVRFMHEPHSEAFEVEAFFNCPVRFGASENSLVFDSDFLFVPIPTHDPSACAALQREAESLLAELREPTAFRRDVVNAISCELREGRSGIREVANRLGMHPKTLGRSLRADGTTYRELLDEVRLHLAQRYLEQEALCVAEIAFRLGYSEKSAFNRAFKRWTGRTPESFRVA